MSAKKELQAAIRACERAGLVYTHGKKHARLTDPSTGRFVSISCTPSGQYAGRAVLRDVKRYLGLTIEV